MTRRFPGDQKKRQKKRLFFGLLIFIVVLVLGLLGLFWKDILGIKRWDGNRRFNIIVNSSPLLLLSLDPMENEFSAVSIPSDAYMEVVSGYGNYKAESIYPLGELDQKRGGGNLLASTIQNIFGLPIDGYLSLRDKTHFQINSSSEFIQFKNLFFTFTNMISLSKQLLTKSYDFSTNLTLSEFIRFFWNVSNLRSDQVKFYNPDRFSIIETQILPDGSRVGKIDPDKLDKTLENVFTEKEILKEDITISIYNATHKSGVGSDIARIISNIGGRVVYVGNYDTKNKQGCIMGGNSINSNSYTKLRLSYILGCKISKDKSIGEASDLYILIGEDYIK